MILEENYNEPIEDIDEALIEYLSEEEVEEDMILEIHSLKQRKRLYVYEKLHSQNGKSRYELKQKTLSNKLREIAFDAAKTIEEDGIPYVNIRLKSEEVLPDRAMPKQIIDFINPKRVQEVSFICDKFDIEYLISELKKIQRIL